MRVLLLFAFAYSLLSVIKDFIDTEWKWSNKNSINLVISFLTFVPLLINIVIFLSSDKDKWKTFIFNVKESILLDYSENYFKLKSCRGMGLFCNQSDTKPTVHYGGECCFISLDGTNNYGKKQFIEENEVLFEDLDLTGSYFIPVTMENFYNIICKVKLIQISSDVREKSALIKNFIEIESLPRVIGFTGSIEGLNNTEGNCCVAGITGDFDKMGIFVKVNGMTVVGLFVSNDINVTISELDNEFILDNKKVHQFKYDIVEILTDWIFLSCKIISLPFVFLFSWVLLILSILLTPLIVLTGLLYLLFFFLLFPSSFILDNGGRILRKCLFPLKASSKFLNVSDPLKWDWNEGLFYKEIKKGDPLQDDLYVKSTMIFLKENLVLNKVCEENYGQKIGFNKGFSIGNLNIIVKNKTVECYFKGKIVTILSIPSNPEFLMRLLFLFEFWQNNPEKGICVFGIRSKNSCFKMHCLKISEIIEYIKNPTCKIYKATLFRNTYFCEGDIVSFFDELLENTVYNLIGKTNGDIFFKIISHYFPGFENEGKDYFSFITKILKLRSAVNIFKYLNSIVIERTLPKGNKEKRYLSKKEVKSGGLQGVRSTNIKKFFSDINYFLNLIDYGTLTGVNFYRISKFTVSECRNSERLWGRNNGECPSLKHLKQEVIPLLKIPGSKASLLLKHRYEVIAGYKCENPVNKGQIQKIIETNRADSTIFVDLRDNNKPLNSLVKKLNQGETNFRTLAWSNSFVEIVKKGKEIPESRIKFQNEMNNLYKESVIKSLGCSYKTSLNKGTSIKGIIRAGFDENLRYNKCLSKVKKVEERILMNDINGVFIKNKNKKKMNIKKRNLGNPLENRASKLSMNQRNNFEDLGFFYRNKNKKFLEKIEDSSKEMFFSNNLYNLLSTLEDPESKEIIDKIHTEKKEAENEKERQKEEKKRQKQIAIDAENKRKEEEKEREMLIEMEKRRLIEEKKKAEDEIIRMEENRKMKKIEEELKISKKAIEDKREIRRQKREEEKIKGSSNISQLEFIDKERAKQDSKGKSVSEKGKKVIEETQPEIDEDCTEGGVFGSFFDIYNNQ